MGSGGKRGLFTLGLGNRELGLGLGNLGNPRAAPSTLSSGIGSRWALRIYERVAGF